MKLIDIAKELKKTNCIYKPIYMFDIYEFHFSSLRKKSINLLEIGVLRKAGSLKMWKKYFANGKITGIDKKEKRKKFEEKNINIFIGDQCNDKFIKKVNATSGPFDIIIDDGGHTMKQQKKSFEILFPLLTIGGIYVIEDIYTSYWPKFGGCYECEKETTIEVLKKIIDKINCFAYYSKRAQKYKQIKEKSYLEKYIYSLHIYPNICFIYKNEKQEKFNF
jgi:hypothetical protein